MNKTDEIVLNHIKLTISQRSAAEQEAISELADHFRTCVRVAGTPVGELALAMVAIELQSKDIII